MVVESSPDGSDLSPPHFAATNLSILNRPSRTQINPKSYNIAVRTFVDVIYSMCEYTIRHTIIRHSNFLKENPSSVKSRLLIIFCKNSFIVNVVVFLYINIKNNLFNNYEYKVERLMNKIYKCEVEMNERINEVI